MKYFLLSILLCSFYFSGVFPAHAAGLVSSPNNLGLVGYWKFDEGAGTYAGDFSGRGNAGTLTSSPTWGSGIFGKALTFNGTSNYVSKSSPSGFNTGTSARTIAGWIKVTDTSTVKVPFVYGVCGSGNDGKAFGVYLNASETLNFWGCGTADFSTGTTVSTGVWHHVAVTYDGTNVQVYVDGVAAGSAAARTLGSSAAYWQVGGANLLDSNNYYFSGSVDEVRVYTRALSTTEIAALYNTRVATFKAPSDRGLLGYWKFDEGAGTQVLDYSGRGFTGALTGTQGWGAGKLGKAFSFNGASYFDMGTSATLYSSTFTASAWVYPTSYNNNYMRVLEQRVSGGGFDIEFDSGDAGCGDKRFYGVVWDSGANATRICASSQTSLNEWHHVVFSYSGGTGVLYVDGVQAGSGSATLSAPSSYRFRIGAATDGGTNYFNGKIDEVRIYNRAFSASEVLALYTSGAQRVQTSASALTTGSTLVSNLVGHWTFDGSKTLSTITDSSSSGNNGYFIGSATSSAKVAGKLGQAFNFNGSNNYVSATKNSLASSFTVAGWFNKSGTLNQNILFGNGRGGASGWAAGFGDLDGEFRFTKLGVVDLDKDIGSWPTGWNHVAWVVGSDYDVTLYINGVSQGTYGNTQTVTANSNTEFALGAGFNAGGTASQFWQGKLDDMRVYSRALSAGEVKQLYLIGK